MTGLIAIFTPESQCPIAGQPASDSLFKLKEPIKHNMQSDDLRLHEEVNEADSNSDKVSTPLDEPSMLQSVYKFLTSLVSVPEDIASETQIMDGDWSSFVTGLVYTAEEESPQASLSDTAGKADDTLATGKSAPSEFDDSDDGPNRTAPVENADSSQLEEDIKDSDAISSEEDFEENCMIPLVINLVGRSSDISQITVPLLSGDLARQLAKHLPLRYQQSDRWSLIFSAEQHGRSLQALYDNCWRWANGGGGVGVGGVYSTSPEDTNQKYLPPSSIHNCPSIMAVMDTAEDCVFGAFVTDCWRDNSGTGSRSSWSGFGDSDINPITNMAYSLGQGRSYYGTAECFLWKYEFDQQDELDIPPNRRKGTLQVYPASHSNDYFQLSEKSFLALGGDSGGFGLLIGGSNAERTKHYVSSSPLGLGYGKTGLVGGYSRKCKTFDHQTEPAICSRSLWEAALVSSPKSPIDTPEDISYKEENNNSNSSSQASHPVEFHLKALEIWGIGWE